MELEADGALPALHIVGKLLATELSLARSLSLGDLTAREHSELLGLPEREWQLSVLAKSCCLRR